MRRRQLLKIAALLLVGCASGPKSRLHTLATTNPNGEISFEIENRSSAVVNNLFLAKSSKVAHAERRALESGTAEQAALWGEDLLKQSGLEHGGRLRVPVEPGRYDVRAVDRDGREQRITGIALKSGGRYRLELGDGSWRAP